MITTESFPAPIENSTGYGRSTSHAVRLRSGRMSTRGRPEGGGRLRFEPRLAALSANALAGAFTNDAFVSFWQLVALRDRLLVRKCTLQDGDVLRGPASTYPRRQAGVPFDEHVVECGENA
jgi:hypothetical protein